MSAIVAFAVGGLLGDTIFHLLPEIFLGEDSPERVKFVLIEPNRNLLLGVAILIGFVTFVAMDKGLRIASTTGTKGGDGHVHQDDIAHTSAVEKSNAIGGMRSRKGASSDKDKDGQDQDQGVEINASVKLGGYLNLMYVWSMDHFDEEPFSAKG